MSDEIVKIIRIESDGAEQTVAGLVNEIKNLTEAMNGVAKGTEDYTNILKELAENQEKLGKAMKTNKQEVTAAEGSYNALVKQMASLKKQWKETTDEVSRKALGNQIKDINGKLKKMDASIGNFQRNVGNYADGVKSAFGSMGGAAKGMVGPLNSVKQGFNALSAHPLMAVLTALAALLVNGIAKGFKNSEEAANKTKVAFAALQGIADAVNKAFEKVALWLANLTEKAVALIEKLGWLSPELKKSMEDRKKIAQEQIKLDDKQRENIKKNADLEKEVAELRAQAADKTKYTAAERLKFLEEAELKEQEIAKNEVDALQLEYDIAYAKLQINKDNAELKQIEAEAYAKLTAAQTAYAQKVASSRKTISKTFKEMQTDAQQANQARLNLEKELIQQELELAEDGSDEQLKLAKELRDKELEIQKETLKQKIKNREDYEKAVKLATEAYNKDIIKLEREHARKEAEARVEEYSYVLLTGLREGSKEYYTALGDIANKTLVEETKLGKKDGETDTQFKERLESYKKQVRNYYDQGIQAAERETQVINQIILNGITPMSKYYRKQYDQLRKYYDDMQKLEGESNEDFAARQDAAWKAVIDSLANMHQAVMDENAKYNEALNIFYRQTDGIFDNLETEFKQYKQELDYTMIAIQNIVVTDMDKIVKSLGEKAEMFKATFHGMLPTPQNIKDILYGDDFEEVKKLMGMLIGEGLLPDNVVNSFLEALEGLGDTQKRTLQTWYTYWDDFAKGIADTMGGISDIYSVKLEKRKKDLVKEGKYTEQERKNLEERYRTVQRIQIAEATINTISGAVAAFMKCQELGQPWGAILGTVQAAAVTAAGIAQVMKIRNTNPYEDTSSSLSTGGMMSATVAPTVSDYNPEYTSNLTGRSDTDYLNEALGRQRLFVSVVDINDAQERGRVRVAESSF
jgi:hypothetical protein